MAKITWKEAIGAVAFYIFLCIIIVPLLAIIVIISKNKQVNRVDWDDW